jgi:hypothetical protein
MHSIRRFVFSVPALAALTLVTSFPAVAQQKNWKDNSEYNLANSAYRDADPATKLADLDEWTALYPATEFSDEREQMYLSVYQKLNLARRAFGVAQELLQNHPNNYRALVATLSSIASIHPSAADLEAAEKSANYLIANLDTVFAPSNRPLDMSSEELAQAKDGVAALVQQALETIRSLR